MVGDTSSHSTVTRQSHAQSRLSSFCLIDRSMLSSHTRWASVWYLQAALRFDEGEARELYVNAPSNCVDYSVFNFYKKAWRREQHVLTRGQAATPNQHNRPLCIIPFIANTQPTHSPCQSRTRVPVTLPHPAWATRKRTSVGCDSRPSKPAAMWSTLWSWNATSVSFPRSGLLFHS